MKLFDESPEMILLFYVSLQEEVDEVTGEIRRKGMLDKYDEEIEGEKKKNFRIGDDGSYNQEQQRKQVRGKLCWDAADE